MEEKLNEIARRFELLTARMEQPEIERNGLVAACWPLRLIEKTW